MIPTHDIIASKKRDVIMNELVSLTHYDSSEPHRHNYFEFFYFQNGGGIHLIDFVPFPIESDAIHIVAPGQVHQVKRELDSNGFVFLFDINLFDNYKTIENFLIDHTCLDVESFKPVYHFNDKIKKSEISFVVNKAWREYNTKEPYKNQLVTNLLAELMLYCMRQKTDSNSLNTNPYHSQYIAFRRLLNSEFKTLKKVTDYAALLNLTEKQLNEIVFKRTGETVSTLIFKQVILEAKRLLNTGMPAKEVSYALNFLDPGHFSKFFKNQTGISPSEFKKIHE